MNAIPHDPKEVIAVVDEHDKVIGETTRRAAHERGLWHREVYVYLINPEKRVLLHKRSDTGLWDHSSSGHFPKAQTYSDAAQREFEEELGIKLNAGELEEVGFEKIQTLGISKINNHFARIFFVRKKVSLDEFKIDKKEVEEIKYFDKHELTNLLNSSEKIMTGSAQIVIKKYVLPTLQ